MAEGWHGAYPVSLIPVDHGRETLDKEREETISPHMSETQDIIDLAEDLVALDKHLRLNADVARHEPCGRWVEVRTISEDGRHTGRTGLVEGERCKPIGINLGERNEVVAVFLLEGAEPPEDPKFDMSLLQVEDCLPNAWLEIQEAAREATEWRELDELATEVVKRIGMKPALADVVRAHLKQGRRSAEEEKLERVEEAAESFYKRSDDFGMF